MQAFCVRVTSKCMSVRAREKMSMCECVKAEIYVNSVGKKRLKHTQQHYKRSTIKVKK